jgi:hypothetical protein
MEIAVPVSAGCGVAEQPETIGVCASNGSCHLEHVSTSGSSGLSEHREPLTAGAARMHDWRWMLSL